MTDKEINVAIAEVCGWKSRPDPFYEDRLAWSNNEGVSWWSTCDLPTYCTDLNAMHEAVNSLSRSKRFMWAQELGFIAARIRGNRDEFDSFKLANATARQRAEAYYKVACRK